jgi:uncharacterized RDD family membrane protein YckC
LIEQAATPMQPSTQASKPASAPVQPALPPSLEAWESEEYRHLREPDFALSPPEPVSVRTPRQALANKSSDGKDIESAEPVLATHANLIEFPRELIAPRKRRPRRVEGPLAADGLGRQMSIFEVDPGVLPMHPETAAMAPAWANIPLEAQPMDESEPERPNAPVLLPTLRLAPIGLRLMATLVDVALVAGALTGSALVAVATIGHPLPAGIARFSALFGFLLVGLFYQAIFLILVDATPGMNCAGLSLYTLDGQIPTRSQRRTRLGALLLSVLPVGLGAAWSLFDDDHLCWHDRLSKTYLRKG